jgi:hypothetical protein
VVVRAFRDEPSLAAGRVSGHHQILVIHIGGQHSRPSAARGNGSPATDRRSRAISIRPEFTASYKAP